MESHQEDTHLGLQAALDHNDVDKPAEDGAWLTISQKKAKKKKKKNRPVPLQDFFNSQESATSGGPGIHTELIRTTGGQQLGRVDSPSVHLPFLHSEEAVIADSLLTYFADLLKRIGPVRPDNFKLLEEIDQLDESGKQLIARFPSFPAFLLQSEDVQAVDNYFCHRDDIHKAKELAIDTILNNANMNPWQSTTTSDPSRLQQRSLQPPPIQKPAVTRMNNSLFSSSSFSCTPLGGFGGLTLAPSSSSFSSVAASSISLDGSRSDCTNEHLVMIDSLNKRLNSLTKCNGDLLNQLNEREKDVFKLKETVTELEEKCKGYEKLKADYLNAQRELFQLKSEPFELAKLKPDLKVPRAGSSLTEGSVTESQLIIQLQKQLETEKLNSHSLKHQLEIERAHSTKLAERQNALRLDGSRERSVALSNLNGDSQSGDSLGLQGILSSARPPPDTDTGGHNSLMAPMECNSISMTPSRPSGTLGSTSFYSTAANNGSTNLQLGSLPPSTSSSFQKPLSLLKPTSVKTSAIGEPIIPPSLQGIYRDIKLSHPNLTEQDMQGYLNELNLTSDGNWSSWSVQKLTLMLKTFIDLKKP